MIDQQAAQRSYRSAVNNAQGQHFEAYIKAGCDYYHIHRRAKIEKISEPFRVTQTHRDGRFTGRFTANADPDFQGTLRGGRSIVFEAKFTSTDRIKRSVLTAEQMDALAEHDAMGALATVCVGIKDQFFFIPWAVWRDMKQHFGRVSVTAADLQAYRVRFTGAVLFLDYINEGGGRNGKETAGKDDQADHTGHAADGIQP